MAAFVRVQEVEHDLGEAGTFRLRVTNPDVELRGVDRTTARVRIEFDLRAASDAEADEVFERAQYGVRAEPGLLEVNEPRLSDSGLGSIARILGLGGAGRAGARIVAEIPAAATVAYNGVSADLIGAGLRGSQEYHTVSGDLVLSDTAGELRLRGVSGDVSVRAEAPVRLQANTVSGDLSVIAPRLEDCRIVTVSGDVDLEGDLSPGPHRVETVSGDLNLGAVSGLTLEVRGLSSDVDVKLPHRSEGTRDRRRYIIGDGAAQLLFSSMSGDASVGSSRRISAPPRPPVAPGPPKPPATPTPPAPPLADDEQLRILRALERGEIDVEEASRRLAGRS
jgi:hypothetical protein